MNETIEELEAKIKYLEEAVPTVEAMLGRSGKPVANQYIITMYGKKVFQSYDSIIAVKYNDGLVILGRNWNYSSTTGKYRNEFLGEGIAVTREKIENGTYTIDESL